MEWALAILFGAAIVLLILSFLKADQSAKKVEQQVEGISDTFADKISQLQEQIRKIELDTEITVNEAGLLPVSSKHRQLLRELLDLQKRGYSLESIATKKRMTVQEVEQLLTPFLNTKKEGKKVANE
ncbi:hypothetical protein J9303_07125 [Bacillaceae bacterium Marseille-Q3522]|nr:hypothetical protein [Bacillaceae bacterium Marseille-Q3522]